MLCRVHAPIVGFQHGKPEACEDELILYFMSERRPHEWGHPVFLLKLVDLVQLSGDMAQLGLEQIQGPLMAPHLAGAPLGWAIWGARDSEETEKETSGVLKEPEIGTALGARPMAKESIGRVTGQTTLEK
ncbi:hypothetical protein BHE74_00038488 [Ensete ventricosum]|nr:hypothetical protein BHE74_00038488 [Ensete ventricosum]RZS05717.1 hypothetical protein BHM03_00036255 [Ensete ventricosum]